jgi:hypothetical protein
MLRCFFVSGLRVLLALQPRTTWQDALWPTHDRHQVRSLRACCVWPRPPTHR